MQLEWESLKRMATSRYAGLAVLVPILGWILIVNDEFAMVLAKLTGVDEIKQPSWKIYSLHVGLSLFGLGVGLYYLTCPRVIKESSDFNNFCAREGETI